MKFTEESDGFTVQYGHYSVKFREVLGWDRQVVMQGPDYIHTRHVLHVSGVLNPSVMWSKFERDPFHEVDAKGFDTITSAMLKPRQTLKITRPDGEVWKEAKLDATFGPVPLNFKILKVIGVKTLLVEFMIAFEVMEANTAGGNPPILISNRWVMTHSMDENFTSYYRVQGRAVFDAGVLNGGGWVPDDFRAWLLLPPPPGYKRQEVSVSQGMSGYEMEYSFVDKQQTMDVFPSWLASIQISHDTQGSTQGVEATLMAGLQITASIVGGVEGALAGGGVGGLTSAVGGALGVLAGALPQYRSTVYIICQGTPLAKMSDLYMAARVVANWRLSLLNISSPNVSWHHIGDWTNRRVTVIETHQAGPITEALKFIGGAAGRLAAAAANGGNLPSPAPQSKFWTDDAVVDGGTLPIIRDNQHDFQKLAPVNPVRGEGQLVQLVAAALLVNDEAPHSGDNQQEDHMKGYQQEFDARTKKGFKNSVLTDKNDSPHFV